MYTSSKSCGRCGMPVSLAASVGDRCPACGVRWGGTNTKYVGGHTGGGYSGTAGAPLSASRAYSSPASPRHPKITKAEGTVNRVAWGVILGLVYLVLDLSATKRTWGIEWASDVEFTLASLGFLLASGALHLRSLKAKRALALILAPIVAAEAFSALGVITGGYMSTPTIGFASFYLRTMNAIYPPTFPQAHTVVAALALLAVAILSWRRSR